MRYSSDIRAVENQNAEYLKRFLAYLVYRHCTEAFNKEDFVSRLAFCLFCERLLASLIGTKEAVSFNKVSICGSTTT